MNASNNRGNAEQWAAQEEVALYDGGERRVFIMPADCSVLGTGVLTLGVPETASSSWTLEAKGQRTEWTGRWVRNQSGLGRLGADDSPLRWAHGSDA